MTTLGWTTKLAGVFCVLLVTRPLKVSSSGGEVGRLTASAWRQVTWVADGYKASTRGRSKVECVRECTKYSHCSSFVFNATTRTCYLQPERQSSTHDDAHLGQVYVNKAPKCSVSDAPRANGVVVWKHTLTSLRGEVTCHDGFVNTTTNVILQCMAEGSWQSDGRCLQFYWPEGLGSFPVEIPLPVTVGWSVCLTGIPTSADSFVLSLNIGPEDKAIVVNVYFNAMDYSRTIVTNGVLGDAPRLPYLHNLSFPFSVNVVFDMKLKVMNNTYEVYVNDALLLTYDQLPGLPANAIKTLDARNNVDVYFLNLLCSN